MAIHVYSFYNGIVQSKLRTQGQVTVVGQLSHDNRAWTQTWVPCCKHRDDYRRCSRFIVDRQTKA